MPTIVPRGIPTVPPTEPTTLSPNQKDARARAIAKIEAMKKGGSPEQPKAPLAAAPVKQEQPVESVSESPEVEEQESPLSAESEVQKSINESSDSVNDPQAASEDTKQVEAKSDESKDPLSSQYAVLARKEKALRAKVQQQEQAMKAREDALKQREEALNAKDSQYKQGFISKEEFTKNPWKFLAESGISYDQLTEMALNQTKLDPYMQSKIEQLESKLAESEKRFKEYEEKSQKTREEQQSTAYKQAIETIRKDAESLVKSSAEQYELVSATNSVDDIVELIEQTFIDDGVVLTVEEAAAEIEAYLEEEALKLAKLKKVQTKLQPPGTKTVTFKEAEAKQDKQPQMKTLTNAIGAQKPLSARERAILAMKGQR